MGFSWDMPAVSGGNPGSVIDSNIGNFTPPDWEFGSSNVPNYQAPVSTWAGAVPTSIDAIVGAAGFPIAVAVVGAFFVAVLALRKG